MPLRAPKGFIDESDPKVCQIGHPAPPWLVNYADLMTELVCFFIILYALSAALNKNVQNAREQVEKMIEKGEMKGEAKVTKEGLEISLEEQGKNVFFQSGSAELTPEMEELIDKIAPVLQKLVDDRHDVIVEGHTDSVPIKNDLYPSNWELSSARATNVVEYLIQKKGFPPGRMAATGYGEFRPVCSENTPDCLSRNRRVVFLVKNPVSPLAPPGSKTAGEAAAKPAQARPEGATQPAAPTRTSTDAQAKPATSGEAPAPTQASGDAQGQTQAPAQDQSKTEPEKKTEGSLLHNVMSRFKSK